VKVATIGEPPSLDRHWSPSVVTSIPMSHVAETLVTFDGDFNPIPLLAEAYALADGGRAVRSVVFGGFASARSRKATAGVVCACCSRMVSMSLIVRGGGTKRVPPKAVVTLLASSTDMAFWHAGASGPKTTVSARLAHEIGRVRRSTMAGLPLSDARAERFLASGP